MRFTIGPEESRDAHCSAPQWYRVVLRVMNARIRHWVGRPRTRYLIMHARTWRTTRVNILAWKHPLSRVRGPCFGYVHFFYYTEKSVQYGDNCVKPCTCQAACEGSTKIRIFSSFFSRLWSRIHQNFRLWFKMWRVWNTVSVSLTMRRQASACGETHEGPGDTPAFKRTVNGALICWNTWVYRAFSALYMSSTSLIAQYGKISIM